MTILMEPGNYGSDYIVCKDLFKIHKAADLEVVALRGTDLLVPRGQVMAIVGPSGSGKSTLLNILAGYDTPSAGTVEVAGHNLLKMTAGELVVYRREGIGFVWQQVARNLIPYLTAGQNVELPLLLANRAKAERSTRVGELLSFVGLSHRAQQSVDKLSGGEQQRVAIATALSNNPPLILADEPTGELDNQTGQEVMDLLRAVNAKYGTTIVIVTHDMNVAEQVDRVVAMADGRTSTEIIRKVGYGRESEGGGGKTHELAVVDATGRLQIPRDFLERLRMGRRARVTLEGGSVVVRPEE
ncbi:ABC transporter ATP-binding protein [Dehalococcoidia bacterium]|nr:ABC transporter ATP-binding protein [Dehalococcoidia bacterium]